jgi:D-alanyl-D-alanine carboxypeptidase
MQKKRVRTGLLFVILFIIALGLGWLIFSQQASAPSKSATKSSSQKTASTTAEKKIEIALPGAAPVEARVEDYHDPTSLWVVVSKTYPLSNDAYRPADLVLPNIPQRQDKSQDERSVRQVITPDLETMIGDAKAQGYDLMLASGFRSKELQSVYYNSILKASGQAVADKQSALPGKSEHQTGLALDVAYTDMSKCYLEICFGTMPAGKWIAANSYKYGFIVRYPEDKTEITQYQYEPWHLRYVGKPLAKALHDSGLTLDEARPYLEKARDSLLAQHKIQ